MMTKQNRPLSDFVLGIIDVVSGLFEIVSVLVNVVGAVDDVFIHLSAVVIVRYAVDSVR